MTDAMNEWDFKPPADGPSDCNFNEVYENILQLQDRK